METIYGVNRSLPEKEKLKVIAVSNPVYWEGIKTWDDIKLMRKSFLDRDYFMYKIILGEMDNFRSGRKGIFLTNTRHAYNGIKNINNELIWDNCGTFFHQWHLGKSYSVRFHNVLLIIDKKKENLDVGKIYSTGGLEQFDSRDVRVAEGLWDSAFQAIGNKPLAVSLENTPFGRETHFGNLTHRSASGQTMSDAYNALIFLGPLEKLRLSASIDWIYTDEFKKEMEKRYKMTYTEQETKEQIKALGVSSLQELINKQCVAGPGKPRLAGLSIGPIDDWKDKKN